MGGGEAGCPLPEERALAGEVEKGGWVQSARLPELWAALSDSPVCEALYMSVTDLELIFLACAFRLPLFLGVCAFPPFRPKVREEFGARALRRPPRLSSHSLLEGLPDV